MHSNTEPKLHDLLYLKEHLTCNRYLADIRTGFVFKKLKKGNMFGLEQGLSHQLLVFLEGSCTIDYGCFLGRNGTYPSAFQLCRASNRRHENRGHVVRLPDRGM